MLKSVLFILVMICFLTTPTRAYEAYNNLYSVVLRKQQQEFSPTQNNKLISAKEDLESIKNLATEDLCAAAISQSEQNYHIKPGLLQTIASVESGKWSKTRQQRVAWPWTVQHNGHGRFYHSKEEAVNAVKSLQAQGITNIDVGCMQINLKYHGDAFNSIEDAMEPKHNVDYAAGYLKSLHEKNGENWQKTAMQYHSKNHSQGLIYKKRLERIFAKYINPEMPQTLF